MVKGIIKNNQEDRELRLNTIKEDEDLANRKQIEFNMTRTQMNMFELARSLGVEDEEYNAMKATLYGEVRQREYRIYLNLPRNRFGRISDYEMKIKNTLYAFMPAKAAATVVAIRNPRTPSKRTFKVRTADWR